MPYIDLNGANLYYETFGTDRPARAPIVLIHGSTITGQTDWSAIAPLLATEYRVIVPRAACHDQSETTHTYSFTELAADVAALIRALGYERAHLIGHGNGALVTLLEHPDVVQTCILQAANAIIGQPNYAPADLAKVTRPALVIQGELDRVNAPDRHAQFIAQHIPDAELWIPTGIGHNVHQDLPLDWLKRVFDFLDRRGADACDALYRLKRQHYADARATIFEVRVAPAPVKGEAGHVAGQVLTVDQRHAIRQALPELSVERLRVLLTDDTPWALVNRAVADVRREPRNGAEQLTQLLIGEAVRVLDERDGWLLIRAEQDGYLGWSRAGALYPCDQQAVTKYQSAAHWLISAPVAPAFDRPSRSAALIGQLPLGARLPVADETAQFVWLRRPDERGWWVASHDGLPTAQQPQPTPAGIAATLDRLRRGVGTPYLWGGRSSFGYDCSGLTQTFYRFMGVSIPRDADQQFVAGTPVAGAPQPGDLVFFGGDDNGLIDPRTAHITHVAIALGGDELLHANGTTWNIAYNSLDPASPIYRAWLKDHLVGVRRFR